VADFNRDGHNDYLLFNPTTRLTAIYYLFGAQFTLYVAGPTITSGYVLFGAADFDGDGKPDYILYDPSTRRTVIWYLNNYIYVRGAFAPILASGYTLAAP
jgi:FG-GAP-like repeat